MTDSWALDGVYSLYWSNDLILTLWWKHWVKKNNCDLYVLHINATSHIEKLGLGKQVESAPKPNPNKYQHEGKIYPEGITTVFPMAFSLD